MNPIGIILLVVIICAVAAVVMAVLGYFSSDSRQRRDLDKNTARALRIKKGQLNIARLALTRIASGEAAMVILEAQDALNEMHQLEMKEIDS